MVLPFLFPIDKHCVGVLGASVMMGNLCSWTGFDMIITGTNFEAMIY
jgi:hypothetical protein